MNKLNRVTSLLILFAPIGTGKLFTEPLDPRANIAVPRLIRHRYKNQDPPSTMWVCPVIMALASEAR